MHLKKILNLIFENNDSDFFKGYDKCDERVKGMILNKTLFFPLDKTPDQ